MAADDIRGALNAQLDTLAPLPIAWENLGYQTPAGPWLRPTFLPGIPAMKEMFTAGADRHTGLFQVDVFAPLDKGDGQARGVADQVISAFSKGSVLSRNGQLVRVLRSYVMPAQRFQDAPYFQIPVRVEWYADV